MSVRVKILSVIGLTFLALLAILYGGSRWFLFENARAAEYRSTTRDVARAVAALDQQVAAMDASLGDWAPWDDTYEFILSGDAAYVDSNLPNETLTNLDIELMLFVNNLGQVVFGKMIDLSTGAEIPIPEGLYGELEVGGRLLSHNDPPEQLAGVLSLPEGPMIIASQPIRKSGGGGPSRGTLIMGRRLNAANMAELSDRTQLVITAFPYAGGSVPDDVARARNSLVGVTPNLVAPQSETVVSGYTVVYDIYGQPALILRVEVPREALAEARTGLRYMGVALLIIGFFLCVVTMLLLENLVISRLTRLNASVIKIGDAGSATSRVEASGNDEIFTLATSVNSMLHLLESLRGSERENERRFRDLLETAELAAVMLDLDGRVTFCNDYLLRITSRIRNEVLGQDWFALFVPPELQVKALFKAGVEQGTIMPNHENEILTASGGRRLISWNNAILRDLESHVIGTASIGEDITERRCAEQALQVSEARWKGLFEASPISLWEEDFSLVKQRLDALRNEGITNFKEHLATHPEVVRECAALVRVLDVNQATLTLMKTDRKEDLLQGLTTVRSGPALESFGEELVALAAGKTHFEREGMGSPLQGGPIHLALSFSAVPGHEQSLSRVIISMIDTTERVHAEQALRQSEAEMRALFASMHDVLLVIDRDGIYREIAPTRPELLVAPKQQLLGKTLRDVFPPEQAASFVRAIQQVLDTKKSTQIEYELVIGGRPMWFDTSITAMTEDSTLWVARDITSRRRGERIQNAIFRITQAAIGSDGIDALYSSIHSILGELIPAENFFIALLDPITGLISFPYYVDQLDEPPIGMTKVQGLTGYVIRTERPLLATQETIERLAEQGEVERLGTVSAYWMGSPLKVERRMIGVMAVQSYTEGIPYGQEDLNLLEFISAQVAQAIERKRMEEEIRNLSLTDELTGLYNRRGFMLLAERELLRAQRQNRSMLLCFLDMDGLKTINDTLGHAVGDLALKEVASMLQETFRAADIPARVGGDEFVVLVVDASAEMADVALGRVQAALERRNQQADRPHRLAVSMGIAQYDPAAPSTLDEMIARADACMYQQKQATASRKRASPPH